MSQQADQSDDVSPSLDCVGPDFGETDTCIKQRTPLKYQF